MTCPRCGLSLTAPQNHTPKACFAALAFREREAWADRIDASLREFERELYGPTTDPDRFPASWEADYRRWLEGK